MFESFHFLRPWWLATAVLAFGQLWLLWRVSDTSSRWRGVIASHLLPHLVSRQEQQNRLRPLAVLALVWVLGIVALAGPTWEREAAPFADEAPALMIVVEANKTMSAQDIQPSRLARAAQKVGDLLAQRKDARAGLVAYAGSAHLVMPLTKDSEIVVSMMNEISPDIMPAEGDAAGAAVRLADRQLKGSGQSGSILLVTDGVADSQRKEIAELRREGCAPVTVYAVAAPASVAAAAGGPPAPPLDPQQMRRVAKAGGGELVVVTPDARDIDQLLAIVEGRFSTATVAGEEGGEHWRDAGYWLLPVILLLALFWTRPGWSVRWPRSSVLMIASLISLLASTSEGGWFTELWVTPDQQAQALFSRGEYGQAAGLFMDPMRRGTALFRAGRFEEAGAEFGRVESATGAFNRGNALVMQGKYDDAIQSYDRALLLKPEWRAAQDNRQIAEIRAKMKERPEGDQGGPTDIGADEIVFDETGKKNQGGEKEEDEGGETELSQQEIQAMWLRRVQTRPADFLRTKFAYQYSKQPPVNVTPTDPES